MQGGRSLKRMRLPKEPQTLRELLTGNQQTVSGMLLDQLDLVPVRVFNKSDHRRSAFHRTGFARNLAACFADAVTSRCRVVPFQRDVAISRAQVVLVDAPVV